jgi:hypothetical protein
MERKDIDKLVSEYALSLRSLAQREGISFDKYKPLLSDFRAMLESSLDKGSKLWYNNCMEEEINIGQLDRDEGFPMGYTLSLSDDEKFDAECEVAAQLKYDSTEFEPLSEEWYNIKAKEILLVVLSRFRKELVDWD